MKRIRLDYRSGTHPGVQRYSRICTHLQSAFRVRLNLHWKCVAIPVSNHNVSCKKSKSHDWMRSCTRPVCPQVAAACRGVHSSLSQAFTQAPASSRHCTTSTKSSMQHWQGRNDTYYTCIQKRANKPTVCSVNTISKGNSKHFIETSPRTNMPTVNS